MDTFAVVLDSADRFRSIDQAGPSGQIVSQHGQMIQGLLDTRSIQLYAQCSLDTELTRRRSTPTYSQVPCALDITVYGPFRLCEAIGSWVSGQAYCGSIQELLVPVILVCDAPRNSRLSSNNIITG